MLFVRDMMVRDPVTVDPGATVAEAAQLMMTRRINSVVVASGGVVHGVLTPRDLIPLTIDGRAAAETRVTECMTADPVTVRADASFGEAAVLMSERRVRHLPVVEEGRLVGMLSVRDLMQHRAHQLERVVRQQTAELRSRHDDLVRRDRRMQLHLDQAGRIQRQLLPEQHPCPAPLSAAVMYRPLQSVSGDCYDLVSLPRRRLGLFIADASGHGVPAALIAVVARAMFQAYGRGADSPLRMLQMMNRRLPLLIEQEHFITMCHATIDADTLELRYGTGGHPPPLWYRAQTGAVKCLPASGHMIGILDEPSFGEHAAQLEPGDMVLFYTDGLIEARGRQEDAFGIDRAASVLRTHGTAATTDMLEALLAAVEAHCGPRGLTDDVTGIAVQVDRGARA